MNFRLLVCLLLISTYSFGQRADSAKNAIGVFGESNGMFSHNEHAYLSTAGLQYNKQGKKYFGYKLILGYASYGDYPGYGVNYISGDTGRDKRAYAHMDMGMIGGGVTFERQFYRKLYFFAGFEARVGHGHGYVDTNITTQYNIQMPTGNGGVAYGTYTTVHDKPGTKADITYAGFSPSIGLQLKLRRFCIGTEFLNYCTYRSIKPAQKSADALFDFDSANITQRLFVQYRF